jgi:hypothetical protein
MKAEEFDQKFDSGDEDITAYLDMNTIRRPGYEQRRVKLLLVCVISFDGLLDPRLLGEVGDLTLC